MKGVDANPWVMQCAHGHRFTPSTTQTTRLGVRVCLRCVASLPLEQRKILKRRECSLCGVCKTTEKYYRNKTYFRPECKPCTLVEKKKRYHYMKPEEQGDRWDVKTASSPYGVARRRVEDLFSNLPKNWVLENGPPNRLHYAWMVEEYNKLVAGGNLRNQEGRPLLPIHIGPDSSWCATLALEECRLAGFRERKAVA